MEYLAPFIVGACVGFLLGLLGLFIYIMIIAGLGWMLAIALACGLLTLAYTFFKRA